IGTFYKFTSLPLGFWSQSVSSGAVRPQRNSPIPFAVVRARYQSRQSFSWQPVLQSARATPSIFSTLGRLSAARGSTHSCRPTDASNTYPQAAVPDVGRGRFSIQL